MRRFSRIARICANFAPSKLEQTEECIRRWNKQQRVADRVERTAWRTNQINAPGLIVNTITSPQRRLDVEKPRRDITSMEWQCRRWISFAKECIIANWHHSARYATHTLETIRSRYAALYPGGWTAGSMTIKKMYRDLSTRCFVEHAVKRMEQVLYCAISKIAY